MSEPILDVRGVVDATESDRADSKVWWTVGLGIFSIWLLFSNLGGSALLEPDEGRNAEIAREILLIRDWVTPHYDFVPRLDKPMLFFDLVALSYALFGISEWSARLPAALAALGCIFLTFFFARRFFGRWTALWSALILLTSLLFIGIARAVMMESLLAFFITLALCCFFIGQDEVDRGKGRASFLLMYAAMGAATATKGPIGFLLPGAVIFLYLLLSKQWTLLRRMEIPLGIPVFIVTAVPWYVLAELRNPGFLKYFLWEQNIVRYTTAHFNRSQPWYFFILVLSAGIFPWSVLLPSAISYFWKRSLTRERLFLVLWALTPLIVFSLSASKLAHYILPMFPAVAIIIGAMVGKSEKSPGSRRLLLFAPGGFFLLGLVATFLVLWPNVLPVSFRIYVNTAFRQFPAVLLAGLSASLILLFIALRRRHEHPYLLLATAVSFVTFTFLAEPIIATVALHRSSKFLAEQAAGVVGDQDKLILFGVYPSSLPFYLRIRRPMVIVASAETRSILGSDYVAMVRPQSAPGYGKVFYNHEEFGELWKASRDRLVLFVDERMTLRVPDLRGHPPQKLLQVGSIVLFENKPIADKELSDVGPRERLE